MGECSTTKCQLEVLRAIEEFVKIYGRDPFLYEICAITGKKPNHLHQTIAHLNELGLLDYGEELCITPSMKAVLELLAQGKSPEEIQTELGMHRVSIANILEKLTAMGLLENEEFVAEDMGNTYLRVINHVYIEAEMGKDKRLELIDLMGCCGYLKNINDLFECVIFYECVPYVIDLDPNDVEQILCYKETHHEFVRLAETDNIHHIKTYLRFHRH